VFAQTAVSVAWRRAKMKSVLFATTIKNTAHRSSPRLDKQRTAHGQTR